MTPPELLRLYRHTLHAAARFPSIKRAGRPCTLRHCRGALPAQARAVRAGVLSEIKHAWREDRVRQAPALARWRLVGRFPHALQQQGLQDAAKVEQKQKLARDSLQQLQHYVGMREVGRPALVRRLGRRRAV